METKKSNTISRNGESAETSTSLKLGWLIKFIDKRPLFVLTVLAILSGLIIIWHFDRLSLKINESTVKHYASLYSQALTTFRTLYTSEVVARVNRQHVNVTHDYQAHKGAIPLPATLSIKLGKEIGASESGSNVRLFSDYPFPWRKDGGPHDEFDHSALSTLKNNPLSPVSTFEKNNGEWTFRYAVADRMRAECVNCHNNHPQSPKRDWKAGDVRGVLEVSIPMAGVKQQTRDGIIETIILMTILIAAGLSLLALVIGGLHRSISTAQSLTESTKRINHDLETEISERKKAEQNLEAQSQELATMNKELQHEISERLLTEKKIQEALLKSELSRNELEEFNRFAVGRELKMVELKEEINALLVKNGNSKRYDTKQIKRDLIGG